jgi:pimeloyl-ACP methyl ester carboxylesterase
MASQITIKKAYADTPHGQVHYRYVSPANPTKDTLIFLHKSASSSVSYTNLITHYASLGHPCYAPDMPGFGGSFDPSESTIAVILEQNTKFYVELFWGVFTSLGLVAKGFHVMGHHSGASLAAEMGATYPETVKSICLVGAAVMPAEDRAAMKEKYFATFNKPVADGSHLLKTWDYLRMMGVNSPDKEDLDLFQREAVDHIRAWKGRNQIYGAVWAQDKAAYLKAAKCPLMAMCARDDVLWGYFENVRKARPDANMVEVKGANFTLDRDVEGIVEHWTPFIAKA